MRIILTIICLAALVCSCTTHYHYTPPIKPEIELKEEPIFENGKPRKTYKFDLTEEERELNKDNEFLHYLETGEYHPRAIKRKTSGRKTISPKQRKAIIR